MNNIVHFKNKLPKEYKESNTWDINESPLANKDKRYAFKQHSKYQIIDFSKIKKEEIKNELKEYVWDGLNGSFLTLNPKNFQGRTLISLNKVIQKANAGEYETNLLKIELSTYKEKYSATEDEFVLFKKIKFFLLERKPFDFNEDLWDLDSIPDKANRHFSFGNLNENRVLNFSKINNQNLKGEIKKYFYRGLTKEFEMLSPSAFKNNRLYPFQSLITYLSTSNKNSILEVNSDVLNEYFKKIGVSDSKRYETILNEMKHILKSNPELSLFKRDVWNTKEINITAERKNATKTQKEIIFYGIKNEENKEILKGFIKYLLLNSQLALSTIISKQMFLKRFLNEYGEKSLKKIEVKDKEILKVLSESERTYQDSLLTLRSLIEYMVKEKLFLYSNLQSLFSRTEFKKKKVTTQDRSVDKRTIAKIFDLFKNEELNNDYLETAFYLLTFCGLRISEVCSLKLNSFYTKDNGMRRLTFDSVKMKKEADVPIIEAVYRRLKEQQERTLKLKGDNKTYLFPRRKYKQATALNEPIQTDTLRDQFKALFKEYGVKNEKGEEFQFKAHDFRHSFATFLADKNVSIDVIKELLAHESPQMTLSYLDQKLQREKKAIEQEIENNSDVKKTSRIFNNKVMHLAGEENMDAIYLKKNLNYQTLPNGTCSLPISQKCPHPNACLTCKSFSTTQEYKEVFKQQLERTRKMISFSEEMNFDQQLKTNQELEEHLVYYLKEFENGAKIVKSKS